MKCYNFTVECPIRKLVGNIKMVDNNNRILMLHGGAKEATMDRFLPLRKMLYKRDVSTASFDFIGHGLTGGDLFDTSLNDRTNQAFLVIKNLFNLQPISLYGTSMGAYTAIKLTEICPIENLILSVPAVYASEAYNVKLGPDFSKIIRKLNSWQKTDAWDIIARFRGKLLIIIAEKDNVIPNEIPDKIYDSARMVSYKKIYTVANSTHMILPFLNDNLDILSLVSDEIVNLIYKI